MHACGRGRGRGCCAERIGEVGEWWGTVGGRVWGRAVCQQRLSQCENKPPKPTHPRPPLPTPTHAPTRLPHRALSNFTCVGSFNPVTPAGQTYGVAFSFAMLLIQSAYTANLAAYFTRSQQPTQLITSVLSFAQTRQALCVPRDAGLMALVQNNFPGTVLVPVDGCARVDGYADTRIVNTQDPLLRLSFSRFQCSALQFSLFLFPLCLLFFQSAPCTLPWTQSSPGNALARSSPTQRRHS